MPAINSIPYLEKIVQTWYPVSNTWDEKNMQKKGENIAQQRTQSNAYAHTRRTSRYVAHACDCVTLLL